MIRYFKKHLPLITNAAIVLFFSIVFTHAMISLYHIITTFAPDFSVYYKAANNTLHHRNPYTDIHVFTGLGYPVMTTFYYIPFLLLPYRVAQAIFIIISFISLWVLIILCLFTLRISSWPRLLLFFSLAFLAFPTKFTLGMGQSNLVAYLFLLLSFIMYRRDKQFYCIIFLSISIILKPVFCFMLLFFVLQKARKITAMTVLFLLCFTLVTYAFYQNEMNYYVFTMVPHLLNPAGREIYYNQGIMGFVSRLIPALMLRSFVTALIDSIVVISICIYALKNTQQLKAFSLVLTGMVLIDSLSWQHHFVFLLFPFIYILTLLKRRVSQVYFYGVILSYILISSNIKTPTTLVQFPFSLVLSHTFYGGMLLFLLLFLIPDKTVRST